MSAHRTDSGFTLVELLVAIALLSVVMLGLVTAMRSFAQTEARVDEHVQRDEELRVTLGFLRTILGEISPRSSRPVAGEAKQIAFAGSDNELNWIGVMPARHGAGGLYHFHLFVRGDGSGPAALILEFAPLTNLESPLDSGPSQSRVMVNAISNVAFRYQDSPQQADEWFSAWPHADRLPRRIGVQIRTLTTAWPEIIVGVLPAVGPNTASGAGGAAGPTIGPF